MTGFTCTPGSPCNHQCRHHILGIVRECLTVTVAHCSVPMLFHEHVVSHRHTSVGRLAVTLKLGKEMTTTPESSSVAPVPMCLGLRCVPNMGQTF